MARPSVVLPRPDSPTRPRASPFRNASETSSTARMAPRPGTWNCTWRLRMATRVSGSIITSSSRASDAPGLFPERAETHRHTAGSLPGSGVETDTQTPATRPEPAAGPGYETVFLVEQDRPRYRSEWS